MSTGGSSIGWTPGVSVRGRVAHMRRVVESRNFVSFVLSAAIGLYLFRSWPFPVANNVLRMALLQKPYLFYASKYAFTAMLFTTPYIILSVLFSSAYIFIVRHEEEVSLARLSQYPQPAMRDELFLAIGEIHHPRRPEPSPNPQWLIVPERGLFTGIAIFGAIGSGRELTWNRPSVLARTVEISN